MMKRKPFLLLAMLVSASGFAQNIDLMKQIPQIEGSWQWRHTVVGGFVGIVRPSNDESFILTIGAGNKMSLSYNGEMLVSEATFEVAVSKDNSLGQYVIVFPEDVRMQIEEKLKEAHAQVITSGCVAVKRAFTKDEAESLVISTTEGVNMGSEGGPDFHRTSLFYPIQQGE